jgi:hypothetical protein
MQRTYCISPFWPQAGQNAEQQGSSDTVRKTTKLACEYWQQPAFLLCKPLAARHSAARLVNQKNKTAKLKKWPKAWVAGGSTFCKYTAWQLARIHTHYFHLKLYFHFKHPALQHYQNST